MGDIPTLSRNLVVARDKSRCVRCGAPAATGHWHHRRSRSIRDDLTHSPANGVWTCGVCHAWLHAHPFEARATGLIVSRYADPSTEILIHALYGPVLLDTDGGYKQVEEESA